MNTYTPLIAFGLMVAAYCIRRFTPSSGILHTAPGAFLIALVSGGLSAVGEAIQAHGLSASVIVPALCTFLGSLIATGNPSVKKGDEEPPKLRALLPFLPIAALLAASCTTPGGAALKACELGKLPAVLQEVVAKIVAIAMQPSSAVADLEQAALDEAPGQFDCALTAVETWMSGSPKKGEVMPVYASAVRLLRAYKAKHGGAACAPTPEMLRTVERAVYAHWEAQLTPLPPMLKLLPVCEEGEAGQACRPITFDDDIPWTFAASGDWHPLANARARYVLVTVSGTEMWWIDASGGVFMLGQRIL